MTTPSNLLPPDDTPDPGPPPLPPHHVATDSLLLASQRFLAKRALLQEQRLKESEAATALAKSMHKCREMLKRKEFARAEEYAIAHGYTVEEARSRGTRSGPLPVPEPPPAPAAAPEPEPVIELINGWPNYAKGELVRYCKNQRQVVFLLDDKREASLWIRGWNLSLGTRVLAKLEDASADPRYTIERVL